MDRGLFLAFALLVLLALTRAQDAGILKVGFIQIAAGSSTSSIFLDHQLLLLLKSNYATAVFMHVCANPARHCGCCCFWLPVFQPRPDCIAALGAKTWHQTSSQQHSLCNGGLSTDLQCMIYLEVT